MYCNDRSRYPDSFVWNSCSHEIAYIQHNNLYGIGKEVQGQFEFLGIGCGYGSEMEVGSGQSKLCHGSGLYLLY